MSRLIDADRLLEYMQECTVSGESVYADYAVGYARSFINNAPTVDPVIHGHWIYDGRFDYICSVCRGSAEWMPPYCYECGSCMDEVVDDGKTD